MELIKILFFIIGSFFGVDDSRVISEKTTVTINPEEKTITILQENLVSLIRNESDSLIVTAELKKISQANASWSSEFADYPKKEKNFFITEDKTALNLQITLTYTTAKDLKAFGLNLNRDGKFSMINMPKWEIKSTDGKLGERYWNFEGDKPFSFSLEPLTSIPEDYLIYKKSLLPFWKSIKP